MRYAQLIERVVALAGLQQASEAERAVEATLPSLAELLAPDDADTLRGALPPQAARWLQLDTPRPPGARDEGLEGFYRRVAERSGLELGFAREQAQAVLAAIGEGGDTAIVSRVVRHVPRAIGALFTAPHEHLDAPRSTRTPGATSTVRAPASAGGRKLSTGRPGSTHPVSEAGPSLTPGLSTGRPGSTRPISEGGLPDSRR